jgi:hypothetical protein
MWLLSHKAFRSACLRSWKYWLGSAWRQKSLEILEANLFHLTFHLEFAKSDHFSVYSLLRTIYVVQISASIAI